MVPLLFFALTVRLCAAALDTPVLEDTTVTYVQTRTHTFCPCRHVSASSATVPIGENSLSTDSRQSEWQHWTTSSVTSSTIFAQYTNTISTITSSSTAVLTATSITHRTTSSTTLTTTLSNTPSTMLSTTPSTTSSTTPSTTSSTTPSTTSSTTPSTTSSTTPSTTSSTTPSTTSSTTPSTTSSTTPSTTQSNTPRTTSPTTLSATPSTTSSTTSSTTPSATPSTIPSTTPSTTASTAPSTTIATTTASTTPSTTTTSAVSAPTCSSAITNGGFESFTSAELHQADTTAQGWTFRGSYAFAVGYENIVNDGQRFGNQVAMLAPIGPLMPVYISQDLSGLTVGSAHVLSFYYDQPGFDGVTTCTLTVTYAGVPVGVVVATARSTQLTLQSMPFTPASGQGSLKFKYMCEEDNGPYFNAYSVIDQVVLQRIGSQC